MSRFFTGIGVLFLTVLAFPLLASVSETGARLEKRLSKQRVNEHLWEAYAHQDTVAVSIFLVGGLSGRALAPGDYWRLLGEIGEDKVLKTLYPTGFEALLSEEETARLLARDEILYVDFSFVVEILLDDVVEIIDAVSVWELQIGGTPFTGSGETVAVIDTGIDFEHPDLSAKNVVGNNLNCLEGGGCFADPKSLDLHGHGTKMAGIIGAFGGTNGVAPGANLIGLKIFPGSSGQARITQELTQAILWCCDHAEEYNISVINLSIGSDEVYAEPCTSGALQQAIDLAAAKNIAIPAGSGNGGSSVGISHPACLPSIVPVAAAKKNDEAWQGSNYNDLVKIFATGGEPIVSTCAGGGYCATGGTSAATAAASGSMAIIQQVLSLAGQPRSMHGWEIETLLYDSGEPISNLRDQWRRISIGAAVRSFETEFRRGDANLDGVIDVSDPVLVFGYLFGDLKLSCEDAADATDNGVVELSDVIYILYYAFVGGAEPPVPFGVPGEDPSADSLGCFEV